jgi:hypothetical protein
MRASIQAGGEHRPSVDGRHLLTEYQGKESAQISVSECVFWNIRFDFNAVVWR